MACFHPIKGYRSESVNPSGKRSIVFDRKHAQWGGVVGELEIPCGQCIGCRLEKSRQWAVRCLHESTLHEQNCFLTLTYNPDNLREYYPDDGPALGTLCLKDFQDFMKRFRERVGSKLRYFHCGEYGEKFGRPHYHALIFGYDFPDKVFWRYSGDEKLYTSELLEDLWEHKGHCSIGAVSFDSAAYVARYCLKKVTGSEADAHYNGRVPEYTTMSRRPGIGRGWFDRWSSDAFPSDFLIVNGRKVKVPKFYDRCFEIDSPHEFADVKATRADLARALKDGPENTYERRLVREEVQRLNLEQSLQRKLENGKA